MDIKQMINEYAEWIKKEITIAEFGEYYELTTPFLDRYNDYLQIYVKQDPDGKLTLTDDGHIIDNLISSGMTFRSNSQRKVILDSILSNYSLKLNGNAIETTSTMSNFPQKKHKMVQAMLHIDDMFQISSDNVKSFFLEDIKNFFESNKIYYSPNFSVEGKTGSVYTYEFHFQRNEVLPERFCKAINKVTESNRNMAIFTWVDTKEKRNNECELFILLNDEHLINDTDIVALKEYNITPFRFLNDKPSLIRYLKSA